MLADFYKKTSRCFMSGVQVTLIYATHRYACRIYHRAHSGRHPLHWRSMILTARRSYGCSNGIGRLVYPSLYIWVFRGTPMMVQAMFLYYGLQPVIGWNGPTAGSVCHLHQHRGLYGGDHPFRSAVGGQAGRAKRRRASVMTIAADADAISSFRRRSAMPSHRSAIS